MKTRNKYLALCLCWCAYSTAYFCRVNLSVALPYLQAEFGYSKSLLGTVASAFFWLYAIGQLINGVLGDRFNPRFFVTIGLVGAGVSNLLFSFAGSLPMMIALWACNGYLQSMLWGPLVRTLTAHTPKELLNRAAVLLSTSMIFGYLISYAAVGRIVIAWGWRWAFLLPGILVLLSAVVWFAGNRALAGQEQPPPESPGVPEASPSGEGSVAFLLRTRLWIVALACIFQGVLKEGLTLWGPTFMAESQSLAQIQVLSVMSLVPFLNFLGLFVGAGINKRLRYHEKRTMIVLFALGGFFCLLLFFSLENSFFRTVAAFGGLSSIFFSINNMITSFVPINFYEDGRVSSSAGFLDCAAYIGAAVSGPTLGWLADACGWKGVVLCWLLVCFLGLGLTVFSRNYKLERHREEDSVKNK